MAFSAMALTAVGLLFSVLTALGEDGKTIVQVYNGRSKLNISISFTEDGFTDFYQCLCSKTSRSCTAFYDLDNNHIGTRNKTQLLHQDSSFYECRTILLKSISSLVCTRLTRDELSNFNNEDAFQNFRSIRAKSCDSKCVGVMGKANQFIQVVRDKFTEIDSCNHKADGATEDSDGPYDNDAEDSSSEDPGSLDTLLVVMYIVLGVVVVVVACAVVWLVRRRLRKQPKSSNASWSAKHGYALNVNGTTATPLSV